MKPNERITAAFSNGYAGTISDLALMLNLNKTTVYLAVKRLELVGRIQAIGEAQYQFGSAVIWAREPGLPLTPKVVPSLVHRALASRTPLEIHFARLAA